MYIYLTDVHFTDMYLTDVHLTDVISVSYTTYYTASENASIEGSSQRARQAKRANRGNEPER
jgi:hypothetical protein